MVASDFNDKLNAMVAQMGTTLQGFDVVFTDIYHKWLEVMLDPHLYGRLLKIHKEKNLLRRTKFRWLRCHQPHHTTINFVGCTTREVCTSDTFLSDDQNGHGQFNHHLKELLQKSFRCFHTGESLMCYFLVVLVAMKPWKSPPPALIQNTTLLATVHRQKPH